MNELHEIKNRYSEYFAGFEKSFNRLMDMVGGCIEFLRKKPPYPVNHLEFTYVSVEIDKFCNRFEKIVGADVNNLRWELKNILEKYYHGGD